MSPERTILTLLLTDLVDSTAIIASLGDERAATLMAKHDRMARKLLGTHRGREIDKSDGFLHTFADALDGILYALAYHEACEAMSDEEGVRLSARAGLHTGSIQLLKNHAADVERGAKPFEIEGIAKATAARIMTLALGGQTLISAATREASAVVGAPQLRTFEHGHYRLKGVGEPMVLIEVARGDRGILAPPPDSPKVHRVVWTEQGWRPANSVAHNLPPEHRASFGRREELRCIADRFHEGARVVSLVGPGGVGKTHIALRFARTWMGDWPDGVWFCDLAEARSELDVAQALGRVLQVPLEQGDPVETLGDALSHRGPTLLILDNFEQIVDTAAETVAAWMHRSPEVGWLITTRQRVDLPGEKLVAVSPLEVPAPDASLHQLRTNPAMSLFVARAQAVHPSFDVSAETAGDVARLIGLLDALPLAIELAAARVRVLSPRKILDRMGRRFDLLRGQRGRGSARQATLLSTIDWSWDLLQPAEQAALAQCAVFEGSFDLDAVEAVIDLGAWDDAPWAMDALESLVDQSLVRAEAQPDGSNRFVLLRSIHEYASRKLDDPANAADRVGTSTRHAAHYARWGDPTRLAELHAHGAVSTRALLQLDLANLVAATRRASQAGDGETATLAALGALALLETTGPYSQAEALAEQAAVASPPEALAIRLDVARGVIRNRAGRAEDARSVLDGAARRAEAAGLSQVHAQALAALGYSSLQRGELDHAERQLQRALELAGAEDLSLAAAIRTELAHVVGIRGGRFDEGEAHLRQALMLEERAGDVAGQALTRSYMGAISAIQGRFDDGLAAYQTARELAERCGDRRTAALSAGMIATVLSETGRLDEAERAFLQAIRQQRAIGDRVHEAMSIFNYVELLVPQNRTSEAATWLDTAIALARRTGDPLTVGPCLATLAELEVATTPEQARQTVRDAEAELRTAGDPTELAKFLCRAVTVYTVLGDGEGAAARLAEAREIAAGLEIGEDSELAHRLREHETPPELSPPR